MKPILIVLLIVCCVSSKAQIYTTNHFRIFYSSLDENAVLNSLIKNNGNIKETLKISDDEFTKQWFAFVKKKYDI
jgi:hypothetical protein